MEPFSHFREMSFTPCGLTRVRSYTDQDMSSLSDPFTA